MINENLIYNPSFQSGTTGYGSISGASSTVTTTTADAYTGTVAGVVTATNYTTKTFTSATSNATAVTYRGTGLDLVAATRMTVTGFTGVNASVFNLSNVAITTANATHVIVTVAGTTQTATGTGTAVGLPNNPGLAISSTYRPAVTAGETYTLSAYVKNPTANADSIVMRLYSYDSSGTASVANTTITAVAANSDWTRLSVTGDMLANAATAGIGIYYYGYGMVNNETFYVDAIQLENSITASPYVEPDYGSGREKDTLQQALTKPSMGDPVANQHIGGLKLESDIQFNGLLLNTIDEYNNIWVCTDIKGWWNLPEPEVPDIARGLDDGSYDVRGRWKARNITLEGTILPASPSLAPAARERLMQTAALVYSGGWLLVNESPVKASYVRLVGLPTIDSVSAKGRINFSMPLRAGDPLKYGWNFSESDGTTTESVSVVPLANTTTTTITNDGNTNVSCVFTITGPMTAPAYIKNTTANTTIKIVKDLRPAGFYQTTVATRARTSGVNTLTTAAAHGFIEGDTVTIAGMGVTAQNGNHELTSVTANTISYLDPGTDVTSATITSSVVTLTTASAHGASVGDSVYVSGLGVPFDGTYTTISPTSGTTVTYNRTYTGTKTSYEGNLSRELNSSADAGTAVLTSVDTLQLDTYNTTVLYRGIADSARSTLDVDIDWIKLEPGANEIQLQKSGESPTMTIKYRSGWIG